MPGTTISSHSSHSCSPSVTVLKKRRQGDLDESVALKAPRRLPVTRSATRLGKGLTKEFPTTQAPPSQAAKVLIAKPPSKPPAAKKIQSNYFLREAARLVGCDLPTTGKRHKVLQFISRVNREQESAAFYCISEEEYHWLSRISEALPLKPRLAYYADQQKLVVEMPESIHETIMNVIRPGSDEVARTLQCLIPGRLIVVQSHPNLTIKAGDLTFVPDFVHAINSCTDPPYETMPVFCEIGASQTETKLIQHLRNVARAYPDAIMILMADIKEARPYNSPAYRSAAYCILRRETSVRSHSYFLSSRTGPRSLDRPTKVVVEGHAWCDLSAVDFQVWIRGNTPIDIDTNDSHLTARGTLFPRKCMDDIMAMMERGLSMMRDRYVDLALVTEPNANLDALRAKQITLPFDWDDITFNFAYSTQTMAYNCYVDWYDTVARGLRSQILLNDGPVIHMCSRTSGRLGRGGGLPRRGRRT
ncbi:hypothetical protein CY34DRAFT_18909 [Suillus luteus UH-Slu-Lm8-n1]|uniref:Uncharacterized protein n=1 Tax=Suillus luteus UH-Slu-Lm8-n1 TaxID=930992 RepID=A0A0C9ZTH6_9AGAM|nr:hypothetical protein CY34DRAFT_18909 [Suillus luteus UH-Slu-Lm8-n1]